MEFRCTSLLGKQEETEGSDSRHARELRRLYQNGPKRVKLAGRRNAEDVIEMYLSEIYERWIGKYERHRLEALHDLKKALEEENDG